MGSTLQEQFLKMGLVDKKQANKIKKTQHRQKIDRDATRTVDESKIQAQQALTAKKKHGRLANQKKNEEAKEQEHAARIRQLIETNRLTTSEGKVAYNFSDNNKIKRLYLQEKTAEQLSKGTLAIVKQAGAYQIIPAEVAEEVLKFNKKLVVVYHPSGKGDPAAGNDPYAEFQVPDDLIW